MLNSSDWGLFDFTLPNSLFQSYILREKGEGDCLALVITRLRLITYISRPPVFGEYHVRALQCLCVHFNLALLQICILTLCWTNSIMEAGLFQSFLWLMFLVYVKFSKLLNDKNDTDSIWHYACPLDASRFVLVFLGDSFSCFRWCSARRKIHHFEWYFESNFSLTLYSNQNKVGER